MAWVCETNIDAVIADGRKLIAEYIRYLRTTTDRNDVVRSQAKGFGHGLLACGKFRTR